MRKEETWHFQTNYICFVKERAFARATRRTTKRIETGNIKMGIWTVCTRERKLIAISNYFDVSLDYLLKDENENESNDNAPETGTIQNTSDRTNWFLGVIICVGGIVCLILWGLLSIFNPTASNQLSESSMIQIDGNGIFLILCIVAIVVGAYLLLKNTTKK